jgi:hypothetical protein
MDNFLVLAALASEVKEGWVWLPLSASWSTNLVRIAYHDRSVICERRVVDANFRRLYEGETGTPLPPTENFAVINAWYRQRLGINDTQIRLSLEIEEENGFWARHVSAFWQHPQAVVRTNILVALVSIGLGFLGLFLGLVSLYHK